MQRSIAGEIGRKTLLLALAMLLMLPAGCAGNRPDLQAVADQFNAPSSWEMTEDTEVVEALCVGPECRTVFMAWNASAAPTAARLESLMQQAGWEDIEVDDCEPRPDITGPVPFCRATAISFDTRVELSAAGPIAGDVDPFRITLRISPR